MNLESQVTDLETSQKLKALGCKQSSLWYWVMTRGQIEGEKEEWILVFSGELSLSTKDTTVSAYTLSELVEMLNVLGIGNVRLSILGADGYIAFGTTVKTGEVHFKGSIPIAAVSALLISLLDKNKKEQDTI